VSSAREQRIRIREPVTYIGDLQMVILVMGIEGTGKTTVGKLLAERLHWEFADADDFHPAANKEKMKQGIALTDAVARGHP
jgi:adenylate kinase family enzyme